MTPGPAIMTAAIFIWLGMVLAISFMEAPLKFRAPGITIRLGLGIGRLVFRALNTAEAVLAAVVVIAALVDVPTTGTLASGAAAIAVLIIQLALVRPRLNRRSDRVLAGEDAPRSRAHYVYVGFEVIKAVLLITTGVLLLAA